MTVETPRKQGDNPIDWEKRVQWTEPLMRGHIDTINSDLRLLMLGHAMFTGYRDTRPLYQRAADQLVYVGERIGERISDEIAPWKNLVQTILHPENLGVELNDTSALWQIFKNPSLGMGESYMEEKWSHPKLDELYYDLMNTKGHTSLFSAISYVTFKTRSLLQNLQTKERSKQVIQEHYDLSAEIYKFFLDQYMQYTCGFFGSPDITDIDAHKTIDRSMSLEQAQINKMERICQKLDLKPGDTVLDIGGGWGGLARYMIENYGVSVEIVTLSGVQADHAEDEMCSGLGAKLHRCDYRDMLEQLDGKEFDKVTCIGMLEHVGHKNIDNFFDIISQALKPGGTGLIHCIFSLRDTHMRDSFVEKYIFPKGELTPGKDIGRTLGKYFTLDNNSWGIEDWGIHYDPTLLCWDEKFKKIQGLDDKKKRMWEVYFCSMAAGFRVGRMSVGQWVFHSEEEV